MIFLFIPVEAAETRGLDVVAEKKLCFAAGRITAQIAFPAERGSTMAEVPIVSLRRCWVIAKKTFALQLLPFATVRAMRNSGGTNTYKRNFIADPTIVSIPATLCVISTSQQSFLAQFHQLTFFIAVEILSLRTSSKNVLKGYSLPQFYYYILQCLLSFTCFAQFQFTILLKI